jgi:exopolysaccharide biosynthesis polyprenyl glycosylphosphotransferase
MLKEHTQVLNRMMVFADAVVAAAAFFAGYLLRVSLNDIYPIGAYLKLLPFFVVIWIVLFAVLGMYNSFRVKPFFDIVSIILASAFIGFVLLGSVIYVLKEKEISRVLIIMMYGIGAVFFCIEKVALINSFRYMRRRGYNTRNILIVGTGRRAQHFTETVEKHDEWGFKVIGYIDEDPSKTGQEIHGKKVIGIFGDLARILHGRVIDHVVFVVPRLWFEKIEDLIRLCETEGIPASVVVDLYELKFARSKQTNFCGIPMLTFESAPDRLWELLVKRLFDILVSAIGLIVLSPLFLVLAAGIKVTSKGHVFFKQKRCGLNGRRFVLYKVRTMVKGAEEKLAELRKFNEMDGPVFKMKKDPRVTPVGWFLRKSSLDELPQLWNVFKGDMSIVGPRPPIPAEVDKYDNWQRRRLSMRPGITCLWQVKGRNEITDFNEWMRLDLEYIDNWSLWLDIKILFSTIPVVLLAKGAK